MAHNKNNKTEILDDLDFGAMEAKWRQQSQGNQGGEDFTPPSALSAVDGGFPPPGGDFSIPAGGGFPPPGGDFSIPAGGGFPPPGGDFSIPAGGGFPPPGGDFSIPAGGGFPPPGMAQGGTPGGTPEGESTMALDISELGNLKESIASSGGVQATVNLSLGDFPSDFGAGFPPPGGGFPPPSGSGNFPLPPAGGGFPPPADGGFSLPPGFPPPGGSADFKTQALKYEDISKALQNQVIIGSDAEQKNKQQTMTLGKITEADANAFALSQKSSNQVQIKHTGSQPIYQGRDKAPKKTGLMIALVVSLILLIGIAGGVFYMQMEPEAPAEKKKVSKKKENTAATGTSKEKTLKEALEASGKIGDFFPSTFVGAVYVPESTLLLSATSDSGLRLQDVEVLSSMEDLGDEIVPLREALEKAPKDRGVVVMLNSTLSIKDAFPILNAVHASGRTVFLGGKDDAGEVRGIELSFMKKGKDIPVIEVLLSASTVELKVPGKAVEPVKPAGEVPEGDKPAKDGDKPAKDGDKPAKDGDKPAKDGDKPAKDGDKPAKDGDKPAKDGDKPAKDGDKPTKIGDKPAEEVAVPIEVKPEIQKIEAKDLLDIDQAQSEDLFLKAPLAVALTEAHAAHDKPSTLLISPSNDTTVEQLSRVLLVAGNPKGKALFKELLLSAPK